MNKSWNDDDFSLRCQKCQVSQNTDFLRICDLRNEASFITSWLAICVQKLTMHRDTFKESVSKCPKKDKMFSKWSFPKESDRFSGKPDQSANPG